MTPLDGENLLPKPNINSPVTVGIRLRKCKRQLESSRGIWYPTKNFDKVVAYRQSETLFRLSSGKPYN